MRAFVQELIHTDGQHGFISAWYSTDSFSCPQYLLLPVDYGRNYEAQGWDDRFTRISDVGRFRIAFFHSVASSEMLEIQHTWLGKRQKIALASSWERGRTKFSTRPSEVHHTICRMGPPLLVASSSNPNWPLTSLKACWNCRWAGQQRWGFGFTSQNLLIFLHFPSKFTTFSA